MDRMPYREASENSIVAIKKATRAANLNGVIWVYITTHPNSLADNRSRLTTSIP